MHRDISEPIDILIADDDETTRLILRRLLEKLYAKQLEAGQLRLRTATDGRETVEMALADAPELILMDIQMPLLNGIDAFDQLKRKLGRRCPGIYFISGYAKSGEMGKRISTALEEGALGFSVKPILGKELGRILRACDFEIPPGTLSAQ